MAKQRVYRKTPRSPEQIEAEKQLREKFQREKPSLEQLVESGEYSEPTTQGEYWELQRIGALLRSLRQQQGLRLEEIAEETGIDVAALSRLENMSGNPTVRTLSRYAAALGKRVAVGIADEDENAITFNFRGVPVTLHRTAKGVIVEAATPGVKISVKQSAKPAAKNRAARKR